MLDFRGTIFVNRDPSGSWSFVGSVPMNLAYTLPDGAPLPPDIARGIAQCGRGLYGDRVKAVAYATREEAEERLAACGYVRNAPSTIPGNDTGWMR